MIYGSFIRVLLERGVTMSIALCSNVIQSIRSICEKHAIHKIVVFGSRARADSKLTSDIDLAVFPAPDFKSKGRFVSEIEDIDTLLKVDIVFVNENTEQKLLDNIMREGVVIYERL